MTAKTKKGAGTKKRSQSKKPEVTKKAPAARSAPTARQTTSRTRDAGVVAATTTASAGTEADLDRLRESTESVYERLRDIDPDTLPADKREEYWRDRHLARTAWEHAENAAFENLVDQQKQQLPAVSASNTKLAKDVQSAANAIGVLNGVGAALGILASVITLLA
jgi:hypothetical protein